MCPYGVASRDGRRSLMQSLSDKMHPQLCGISSIASPPTLASMCLGRHRSGNGRRR
jgi:hypothetical protein